MSEKYKKTCNYLNYAENLLILASTIAGCIFFFAFGSLIFVPIIGITSSAKRTNIYTITAGIKSVNQL